MRRFSIILCIALLAVVSTASMAAGKLVIVVVGGTNLEVIVGKDLPSIHRLIERGAVGVMNARPASVRFGIDDDGLGGYTMEGCAATISAGTRAGVTVEAREAYSIHEKAEDGRQVRDLYASRYAQSPGTAEVVHLGMNRLAAVNREAKYPVELGAVGDVLHRMKLKTAVIGNSDTPTELGREISLIVADKNGIIDFGDVSDDMILRDPTAPYGIRTDSEALLREFDRVFPKSDLIVVDVGDTARAAAYASRCTEKQAAVLESAALRNADDIIGRIASGMNMSRDRILVLSTNTSAQAVENEDCLPPIIAAGFGIAPGLLVSGSTRRAGIITNTDVSASVLDFFGVEKLPYSFVGRPVSTLPGSADELATTNHRVISQMQRQGVMGGLAAFMFGFVIVISAYLLWRPGKAPKWLGWLALVPVSLMLAVLWLPAVAESGLVASIFELAGLAGAFIGAGWLVLKSPSRALFWLCGAVVVTILLDLSRSPILLRDSIMSYTPVDGARYYGIGNEHMGSLIGAAMIGAASVLLWFTSRRLGLWLIAILLATVAVAIGLPSRGANAGGAMSAVPAAVVGLLLWRERGFSHKHVVAAILAVPAMVGLMLLLDVAFHPGGSQSHVGRAAAAIASGGMGEMLAIIGRKLEMNATLIQYSPWSKLFIASLASVVAMLWSGRLDLRARLRENRVLHSGIIAAAVGTFAALAFNDSGVVAAATAFIYVWTAMLIVSTADRQAS